MPPTGGDRGGLGYLLIGQPAISSVVARALATKGDQPQYVEGRYELGVQALDLTDFEYRWLRRSQTWYGNAIQAAVAGQIQGVQFGLTTPSFGRILLAVLEEITLINQNAAALTLLYGLSSTVQGATSGPFLGYPADDRSLDNGPTFTAQSAGFVATLSAVASPFAGMLNRAGVIILQAGASAVIKGPWIISGKQVALGFSSSFCVAGTVANQVVGAGFRWYERELLASEL